MEWVQWVVNQVQCKCQEVVALVEQVVQAVQELLVPELVEQEAQVLEGLDKNFGDNDYGIATERQCMERAPSDNQERCDFVQLGLKKVSITVSIVIIIMLLLSGVHVLLQG